MAFLPRTSIEVDGKSVVLYAEPDFLPDCPRTRQAFEEFAHRELHRLPSSEWNGVDHAIAFMWGNPHALGSVIIDFWKQMETSETKDGFLTTEIQVFNNGTVTAALGIASGTTRIVSGLEELYRREVMDGGGTFQDYLYSKGPMLPPSLQLSWDGE